MRRAYKKVTKDALKAPYKIFGPAQDNLELRTAEITKHNVNMYNCLLCVLALDVFNSLYADFFHVFVVCCFLLINFFKNVFSGMQSECQHF